MRAVAGLLIGLFLALPAVAETVRVRSGEHNGFSRLVLDFAAPVDWTLRRTDDGYRMVTDRTDVRYDVSRVFDLIPRSRLATIWADPDGGGLLLGLGCACHADAFALTPQRIVIDLKPGPAPADSPFEQTEAGEPAPMPDPRVPARPKARPEPLFDTAGPAGSDDPGVPASPPLDLALDLPSVLAPLQPPALPVDLPQPAPDLTNARDLLLRQIAQAASQGVIEPVDRLPRLETPAAGAPDPMLQIRIGDESIHGTYVGAHIGPIGPMTATGGACLPDSAVNIAEWAGEGPFWDQISALRTAAIGEFDEPRPEGVEAMIRLYLHFGFGAEAASALREFGVTPENAAIYAEMARIFDEAPPGAVSPFDGMEVCDGQVALWAVLARDALPPGAKPQAAAVYQTFSGFPLHLRERLGPSLASRFLAAGDTTTARRLQVAMARAPGPQAEGVRLAGARLNRAEGAEAAAEAGLRQVAAEDGPLAPEALQELTRVRLDRGEAIDPDTRTALASFVFEYQDDPRGGPLADTLALAQASAGEFDAAFATARSDEARGALWKRLAETGPDAALMLRAFAATPGDRRSLPPTLRNRIAERLIGLGFPEAGLDWIGPDPVPEAALLRAEAAVALRDGRAALAALDGLTDPAAQDLRARAYALTDDRARALAETADPQVRAQAAWRARDWAAVADLAEGPRAEAAAVLAKPVPADAGPPAEEAGPLARASRLIADSARDRATLGTLLSDLPRPDGTLR